MMPFIELFLVLSGFTIIYFITRYFRLRVTLSGQKIIPNSEKSSNSKIVLKSEDIVPAAKQVSVIKKDKGEIVVFSQKSNTITIQEMPGVKEYKKEIVTQVTQSPQNIEKSVEKNVLCLAEENLSLNQTQIDNSWNSIDRNEIQNQSQSAELTQKTTFLSAGKIESDSTKFGIKITPIISPNIGEENTTDLKFGYDERLKESIGLTLSTLVILAIEPKITVLSPNQEQLFTITGIDQFGQKIEPGKLIWRATGGVIDSTGKLIVSPDAKGAFSITVVSIESGIKRHNPAKNLLLIKVSLQLFSLLLARKRLIKEVLNYVVDELGISKARDILDEHLNDDFYSFSELLIFDEVTERLTEWIVGMVVDKLIDYLGKFTSVCFDSSSNKIVCYSNYIVLPELSEIEILPITTTAKLGNGLQLELRGKDQAGEEIKIDKKILWSTTAGEIGALGSICARYEFRFIALMSVVGSNIIAFRAISWVLLWVTIPSTVGRVM